MDVKIQRAFVQVQESFSQCIMREVQDHAKTREFLVWAFKTHGINFGNTYWNFLISKDLPKATEKEKGC